MQNIGIKGVGIYLPPVIMSAKQIAEATCGRWTEEAVINKLGIRQKYLPGENDGTESMAIKAASNCLNDAGVNPKDIDLIISMGEEWKEYPIVTSACVIAKEIGADNAWAVDIQNRCCSGLTAIKMAKDIMTADERINLVLIAGGYRNGDLIDFKDADLSVMYDLSAGGGAILLQKGLNQNIVLGSGIITDTTLARSVKMEVGGISQPFNEKNISYGYKSLKIEDLSFFKSRLNEVSRKNWLKCIDMALAQSGLQRKDIDFVNILHIKRSEHKAMLQELGLSESNSLYLEDYGHMGQIDQMLSLKLSAQKGLIKDGDIICMLSAGVGGVWAASILKWGKC